MSLSLLLISVLAAPKAPTDSEMMVYLPKVDAVSQLLPFFNAAGSRAPLLRPESWRSQAHPLIEVDLTSKEALALVGIDSTSSITNSRLGDTEVACVMISDVDKYRKAADAKLARLGEVFEKVESGVSVYATRDALGRVLAAYALRGRDSCAISGHGRSVEKQLSMLAQTVLKPVSGPGLTFASKVPGVIQVLAPNGPQHGVVSLNAKDLVLTADAKTKGLPLAQLAGGGASPLGGFAANGMVVLRARVAKTQVPSLVEAAVKQFPGGAALLPIAREAAPLFTGNAALLLSHAKVTTGLRSREARFFALRSALIAEVSDPAAVGVLISKLDSKLLTFREGTISVALEGSMLIVSNDPEVRAKAMTALKSAAGKQVHGVEFEVDPKLIAKALQQVPLLEAVQTPELAGLVAAGTELGPLLLASERVSGWLDSASGGVHTSQLVWRLEASKFAPDAGIPADAGTR